MKERKILFEIKMLDNMIDRKICGSVEKNNLTHTQARVLKFLYDNRDRKVYQTDIEKEVDVRRSTVSGVLDTMERNNLIIRKSSSLDARKKEIALTESSLNKHKEIVKKISNFEKVLLDGITKDEIHMFIEVIDKLKKNLKK